MMYDAQSDNRRWFNFTYFEASNSLKTILRLALVLFPLLTTGCGNFWVDPDDSNTGGATVTAVYVANVGTSSISAFSVSDSGVNRLSGSPISLPVAPTSLTIAPNNALLFSGSVDGGIYAFGIDANGTLHVGLDNNPAASLQPTALKVDPSGKWLIAVDATPAAYVYSTTITQSRRLLHCEGCHVTRDVPGFGRDICC